MGKQWSVVSGGQANEKLKLGKQKVERDYRTTDCREEMGDRRWQITARPCRSQRS
jgi:hypothetical protein